MHVLNRFETNLLTILYAVLGDTSMGQVMPKVHEQHEVQDCLSRQVVELVQAALAKGMTHWLASRGGWHRNRFLRGEKPAAGTIWQRTQPHELGLTFSAASLQFLIWLTANNPLEDTADPWRDLPELTVGDQLLMLRTLERLRDTLVAERWFRMRKFASLPLVSLCYPDLVAERERPIVPDFSQLPELAWVLECLQPHLAKRWIEVEQSKACIAEPERMQSLGATQTALLSAFLSAAASSGRRDLARFLLVAFEQLIATSDSPEVLARRWIGDLRVGAMRLAERTIVYQSASSFLAIGARLRSWTQECRQVGYLDEGYAAAQLWLADWARYDGDNVTLRAAAMVRALTI